MLRAWCVAVLIGSLVSTSSFAAMPEQIDASIRRAVEYLYSKQVEGIWEVTGELPGTAGNMDHDGMHYGGLTACATYALLAAGESPQDPRLAKAIEFLKKLQTQSAYVIGMRAQIWAHLPESDTRQLVKRDLQVLVRQIKAEGAARGLFHYPVTRPEEYDHSISQFGVLGLWACQQQGGEIATQVWDAMDQGWRKNQDPSGGWAYITKARGVRGDLTLSMTAAGVASLFITHDFVHAGKSRGTSGNSRDDNIEYGLKWIAESLPNLEHERNIGALTYTLYAIERIGVTGGYKYIGKTNWYEFGSELLLRSQDKSGRWSSNADWSGMNINSIPTTAFGILFLVHGRAPVAINKLSYASTAKDAKPDWNQRPRDIANLVRWTGSEAETLLNWHIVPIDAPLIEWHDAPILYLSGSRTVELKPGDQTKLRQFVEQGGLIVAHADGASRPFVQSINRLAKSLFPQYEFREISEKHPIFSNQQFKAEKLKPFPRIRGLGNGVRELMILIPEGDPARTWQVPFSGNLVAYALGANLIQYSTDQTLLRERHRGHLVMPDPNVKPTRSIKLARLQYDGNWNPEPGGWERMKAVVHNADKLDLQTETVQLGGGALKPDTYRAAHLTGTDGLKLSESQWDEVKAFINAGGTLLIDAAGGSAAFAESVETGLRKCFPAESAQLDSPLEAKDPTYPTSISNMPLYRRFASASLGELKAPRLRAMKINGRQAVIYSREDLSGGLVGQQVDGILGYTPEAATEIVRSILTKP